MTELQERYDEAEAVLLESLAALEALYDEEHEQVQEARQRLANLPDAWERPQDASGAEG